VEYAKQHGFVYSKIGITGARTRWGSCSAKGSLNFSWRLIMAPLEIIDYVIIHELVHLRYHNHSRAFWKGVADILPDYRARKAWLTQNSHRFTLD
jgi:predicted metal-dependent hydrolase